MTFHASATSVGNSRGLRLDSALFREHPEFESGTFDVDVIAPGHLLVRVARPHDAVEESADPVFETYLGFLEKALTANPERISAFSAAEIGRAEALVEGVEVDMDEDFGDDFELP